MDSKVKSYTKGIILALGLLLLVAGGATAGLKYTEKPGFCVSCHVMEPMQTTWEHSAHGGVVGCNDCHAPADKVEKILYKAISGTGHMYFNTTGQIPDNIRALEKSRKIIQSNCVRCHSQLVNDTKMGGGKYCFECHRSTPHGQ
ncbi:MAG: cytochrome c nitrite reductase small subunit [Thermincolia bacterium]